jgi:hypothetical protein
MRAGNATVLVLVAIFQIFGLKANEQERSVSKRTVVTDPVFGITYNYTKVQYEPISASVRKNCKGYDYGSFWTFAHFQEDGKNYYVVLGVQPDQDGDSLGSAVEIAGSKCQEEDSTWLFSGFIPEGGFSTYSGSLQMPGLNAKRICDHGSLGNCHYLLRSVAEKQIIQGLVEDGLMRGIRAWGGEAQFKKAVCAPGTALNDSATPIVTQILGKFCGVPHPRSIR